MNRCKSFRIIIVSATALALFLLEGCMYMREVGEAQFICLEKDMKTICVDYKLVETLPEKVKPKTITLRITQEFRVEQGKTGIEMDVLDQIVRDSVVDAYTASGLVAVVQSEKNVGTDLICDTKIVMDQDQNLALSMLGFVTLYMIPVPGKVVITVMTTFSDWNERVLLTTRRSASVTYVHQFFTLFLTPFVKSPGEVLKGVIKDVSTANLYEARVKGVI